MFLLMCCIVMNLVYSALAGRSLLKSAMKYGDGDRDREVLRIRVSNRECSSVAVVE